MKFYISKESTSQAPSGVPENQRRMILTTCAKCSRRTLNLEKSKFDKEMKQYTATTFIEKARFYLSQSPPDLVQASEKIWFAVVYAVKKLFLSLGGVDLKSDDSLEYFCQFALASSELPMNQIWNLDDCWIEEMHQNAYGAWDFHSNEYARIITDVETFVKEFDDFDQRKLWDEFERTDIYRRDRRKCYG